MQGLSKRLCLRQLRKGFHDNHMRSGRELAIESFLTLKGYNPEHSVREYGTEFDLYVRSKHIAVEFNGVAYHFYRCNHRVKGRSPKSMSYHRDKSLLALNNGILLYHFWDYEPIEEVKLKILKILEGVSISDTDADKNPSLLADTECVLKPVYVFADNFMAYRKWIPYNFKPLCWSERGVTIYEIYNSGYLCRDANIKA